MLSVLVLVLLVILLFVVGFVWYYYWIDHHFVKTWIKDNNFVLPIYIISLEKHHYDRLLPLLARIKPNKAYEIRDTYALDGQTDVIEAFLSKGQIGCWQSHVYMWRQIVTSNDNIALVLEDDANIELPKMLPHIITVLANIPSDFDLCFLGGYYGDTENLSTVRVAPSLVKVENSPIYGTHAYLITHTAATKLLNMSSGFNTSLKQCSYNGVDPVDHWMTLSSRTLNIYKTDPFIINTIGDGVSDTSR